MNLTAFLDRHDVIYRVYHHGQTYGAQQLAQTLHMSGEKISKAVMVSAGNGLKFIVLVVPAARLVDLRRVGAILGGTNVRLATESEIFEHCPGCEFGVVPLFASQYGMETIVDESISKQEELVFQGDTHEETVRMRFADFYALEHPHCHDYPTTKRCEGGFVIDAEAISNCLHR